MVDKKYVRFQRGERVDQPDLQAGVEGSHRDALAQAIGEIFVGPDGSPSVLQGFSVAVAGANVTVTRGSAITGFQDLGTKHSGSVLAGGPASRTYNVATLPDGTYGVYIRLSFRPGNVRGRRFWDVTGPSETTRLMSTRALEDWDVVFEIASPGSEYLKLGTIPVTGGVAGSFTNTAPRTFDATPSPNRTISDALWGASSDRVATDAVGIRSFTKWAWMVMRQLQDIVGDTFFGSSPQSGTANGSNGPRSLKQLNDEKLAKNGAQDMTGNLNPDADGTRLIGSNVKRWLQGWFNSIDAVSASLGQVSIKNPGSILPIVTETVEIGSSSFKFLNGFFKTITAGKLTVTENSAGAPVANSIYKRLFPKAIAYVTTDGAGNATLVWGENIASAAISTQFVNLTLQTAMSNQNFGAHVTPRGANSRFGTYQAPGSTSSILIAVEDDTGALVDLSATAVQLLITIWGDQP